MTPSTESRVPKTLLAKEMLRRQRARSSLIGFSGAIEIPGKPVSNMGDSSFWDKDSAEFQYPSIETGVADLHLLMMREIEQCVNTDNGRLMMMFPPGSGKSSYLDVVTPPYLMGKIPGYRIILGSYASTIAIKQSRKARAVCRQDRYRSIWYEKPTIDKGAADEWAMSNGSEFMAAGLLAGITGNRCNLLILDDVVQNREAADSPTIRQKTYDEYLDTALSRLLPGGSAIIVMTRWHPEDLMGSILPENWCGQSGAIGCRDGQTWRVVCCPAECDQPDDPLGRKPGEFLWNEWFGGEQHWAPWRNNPRAKRTWAALYQQRPTLEEGLHFSRKGFSWYDPDLSRGYECDR